MLRITDHAVSFLDEARSVQHIPTHFGVRVFSAARSNCQSGVHISFSERQLTGDDVTEAQGTRVFVAPEISNAVGDLVLDVDQRESVSQLVLRET